MENENEEIETLVFEDDSDEDINPSIIEEPVEDSREKVDQFLDGAGSDALQKMGVPKGVADHAIKTNGGTFSPNNLPGSHFVKNQARNALANSPMFQGKKSSDQERLQTALNKNQQGMSKPNPQSQENESGGIGKTLDKVGEKSVKKFGGAAITALSGGAISGKTADAAAKAVAKPAGKMFKYTIIFTYMPLIFIVFFCIVIFIVPEEFRLGGGNDGSDTPPPDSSCANIKVRLKKCHNGNPTGKYGDPIQEELIDFEYYILGVTYAEIEVSIAKPDAIKAQAIAARNYTLTRNGGGRIKDENGQKVIEMYSCTDDQAFCDPDQGCHSDSIGGEYSTTIYPGTNGGTWRKPPLKNQKVRDIVAETQGLVAISPKGNIVGTNYCMPETKLFTNYGASGLSTLEILKKVYDGKSSYQGSGCGSGTRPKIVSIKSMCEETNPDDNGGGSKADSNFKNWKQCGRSWSSIKIAGASICDIGCAATSVAIQIANSGVKVNINPFNPGTFVNAMKKNGGFDSRGAIFWEKASVVAPKFKFIGKETVSGSKAQKTKKLQQYLNNHEYIVIGVHTSAKSNGYEHWVALNRISGNNVLIYDPGQSTKGNKLFEVYPYTKTREIAIRRYKVS